MSDPLLYAIVDEVGGVCDDGESLLVSTNRDELADDAHYMNRGAYEDCAVCVVPLYAHPPAALPEPPIPFPGRREVEREIERTENPTGMRLNDSKERVILPGGTLRRMLRIIDATPPARPALPGGGLAAAERLIRLRKNVGNAEYERQCDDWLAHLRLAEGK